MNLTPTSRRSVRSPFRLGAFALAALVAGVVATPSMAQQFYPMSSGNYSQDFTGWTNYPTYWNGLATNGIGTIPSPVRITTSSVSILQNTNSTSGGVQSTNTSTYIQFLSTGGTDNTSSVAADLNLDFSGRNAGAITFDAGTVFNQTGNRVGTLRLYYATKAVPSDVADWTEITGVGLPYVATNNVAGSASVNATLPAEVSGQSTVRLRFYYHNGTGGSTGSRPKISVDNMLVTSSSQVGAPVITSFTPSGGPAGTVVTITGTDFTGATGVAFHGTAAVSFTVDNDTQITATVPSGATTGPISVTTPDGTGSSATDFELPITPTVSMVMPAQILEGGWADVTVSLNSVPDEDVEVETVSSDPAALQIGDPMVVIPAGQQTATIQISAPLRPGSYDDVQVTVTPSASGYASEPGIITVKNIHAAPVSFPSEGYTQGFASFTSAETLPLGWSISGTGQPQYYAYNGDWGTGVNAGMRGNASVFGFQHTGDTAIASQTLTLKNDTGATITDLTVSYLGMVSRATETRVPAYTVTVAGQPVPALAYSTSSGVNESKAASITGLSIAPDEVFQIIWSSDRGLVPNSGSSRQIGIGNVSVTLGASQLPPSVASLSIPPATIGETTAEVSANVTSDGGAAITARGFVYAKTSENANPEIGGANVINVVDGDTSVGAMSASLSGLSVSTGYSIKAYATNAEGTAYTSAQTFTTLAPAVSFDGSYAYPFNAFLGVAGLPGEWTAISSGGVAGYVGDWAAGSSTGGFYGNVSDPGVLGYLHTSGTGTLTVTLRLKNDTGGTLTELNVGYLGRVERVANTRFPAWTVKLDGNEVAALAYSTEGGVDELKSATITGLNIPAGGAFTLTWESDRDNNHNGSSRRIGLANVQVSTQPLGNPTINVMGSLTSFSTTEGIASASQSFAASGSNLDEDIVVTAPTNYEVSLDDATFASSVNLVPSGGSVVSTPVYVRIAATAPVGNPAGLVTLASTGATTKNISVTGTVNAAGSGFNSWSGGQPATPALVGKYAVGGASSATATDGVASATALTNNVLSLTALVRTNDPALTTVGRATDNLVSGPWSTNGVTMSPAPDQSGVPAGIQRQIFHINKGANTKLFLDIQATLTP